MTEETTAVARPRDTQVQMGYTTTAGFELLHRAGKAMASSSLVPEAYRQFKLDKEGNVVSENAQAIPNCMVALNMAARMNADPLMVAQNLYVIEGRPSWSSQWIIAQINQCGRFSPLRFRISAPGAERAVEYEFSEWIDGPGGKRQKVRKTASVKVKDRTCVAWAIERETGETLDGPEVSMDMAVKEGWLTRNGSKWQTMPEIMLRYRASAFFGRLYAPELLMGLPASDEVHDTFDAEQTTRGVFAVPGIIQPRARTEPAPENFGGTANDDDGVYDSNAELGKEPAKEVGQPARGATITASALGVLHRQLVKLYGDVFPSAFCSEFKVEAPDSLAMADVNRAFEWIAEQEKIAGALKTGT